MSRERGRHVVVLEREYAGTTNTLRLARNDVVGCLRAHVNDPDIHERAELVISELATNAIQASPGIAYGLRVSLGGDGSVVMAVTSSTDRNLPPPRESWGPSSAVAPSGRGLLIVGELTDEVQVDQPAANLVVVTATLRAVSAG